MFKKVLGLALCLLFCLPFAGCGKNKDIEVESAVSATSSTDTVEESDSYINPLTGEEGLTKETAMQRPVAIMVNNINVAQSVQTGLNKADIIYETEVEGGITRLMAVFKDFKSVPQVGTIRSARYVYVDLAAGHDAVYAHHGADDIYARPHFDVVKRLELTTGNGGVRVSNGLASEHTLYANCADFWQNIVKTGNATLSKEADPWQNFAKEGEDVKLTNTANTVSVPFSASYKTVFKYNAETGKYTRYSGDTLRKDYKTGETIEVKNVFVLNTTISYYSNNKHRKIDLTSGSGYYLVNGTYTKINWSKGDATNSLKFTNEDGSALTVNPGTSWVCIAESSKSQPTIS